MKFRRCFLDGCIAVLMLCSLLSGQQPAASSSSALVPRLVNFSGKAVDAAGKTISGIAGVTFAIYQEQSGGSPLWIETQNVAADAKGNYTAQLGATKPDGLPLDLFTSGVARWLGVTVNGGEEQPRILLLSVPYALKAADAETVGGLPASAFVRAAPPVAGEANSGTVTPSASSAAVPPPASSDVTTSGGTVNALPLFFRRYEGLRDRLLTRVCSYGGRFSALAFGVVSDSQLRGGMFRDRRNGSRSEAGR